MKVQFGDVKIEFPYEKYLAEFFSGKNPFGTMFPKSNPDSSNELFKMNPSSMVNYFGGFTKMMEKLAKASKPNRKES